jgi:hypothetical protein
MDGSVGRVPPGPQDPDLEDFLGQLRAEDQRYVELAKEALTGQDLLMWLTYSDKWRYSPVKDQQVILRVAMIARKLHRVQAPIGAGDFSYESWWAIFPREFDWAEAVQAVLKSATCVRVPSTGGGVETVFKEPLRGLAAQVSSGEISIGRAATLANQLRELTGAMTWLASQGGEYEHLLSFSLNQRLDELTCWESDAAGADELQWDPVEWYSEIVRELLESDHLAMGAAKALTEAKLLHVARRQALMDLPEIDMARLGVIPAEFDNGVWGRVVRGIDWSPFASLDECAGLLDGAGLVGRKRLKAHRALDASRGLSRACGVDLADAVKAMVPALEAQGTSKLLRVGIVAVLALLALAAAYRRPLGRLMVRTRQT